MYTITPRAITEDDRTLFRAAQGQTARLAPAFYPLLLFGPHCLIAAVILAAVYRDSRILFIGVAAALLLSLPFARSIWAEVRAYRSAKANPPDDLGAATTVEVHTLRTERVIHVIADDVDIWIFDAGEGRLFVWYTNSDAAPSAWPNSHFEILREPNSRRTTEPICYGERIQSLSVTDYRCIEVMRLPQDDFVIPGSLNTFERDFARA